MAYKRKGKAEIGMDPENKDTEVETEIEEVSVGGLGLGGVWAGGDRGN